LRARGPRAHSAGAARAEFAGSGGRHNRHGPTIFRRRHGRPNEITKPLAENYFRPLKALFCGSRYGRCPMTLIRVGAASQDIPENGRSPRTHTRVEGLARRPCRAVNHMNRGLYDPTQSRLAHSTTHTQQGFLCCGSHRNTESESRRALARGT
jgi:hypothetical protein